MKKVKDSSLTELFDVSEKGTSGARMVLVEKAFIQFVMIDEIIGLSVDSGIERADVPFKILENALSDEFSFLIKQGIKGINLFNYDKL